MFHIIILRKLLISDTSSIEITKVVDLLKNAHIPYTLVTKKSQSTFDTMVHAKMSTTIGHGAPASYNTIVGETFYIYNIYVRKRDYLKSKKLISH